MSKWIRLSPVDRIMADSQDDESTNRSQYARHALVKQARVDAKHYRGMHWQVIADEAIAMSMEPSFRIEGTRQAYTDDTHHSHRLCAQVISH